MVEIREVLAWIILPSFLAITIARTTLWLLQTCRFGGRRFRWMVCKLVGHDVNWEYSSPHCFSCKKEIKRA